MFLTATHSARKRGLRHPFFRFGQDQQVMFQSHLGTGGPCEAVEGGHRLDEAGMALASLTVLCLVW